MKGLRMRLFVAALLATTVTHSCGGPSTSDGGPETDSVVPPFDATTATDATDIDAAGSDAASNPDASTSTDAGPVSDAAASSDAASSTDAGSGTTVAFVDTYSGYNVVSNAMEPYDLVGAEPAAPGAYPVFIYTVGTFGTHDSTSAMAWVEEMSSRGFVAATVDYSNGAQLGCANLYDKADGIYLGVGSAIDVLCARPQADCGKGIVTAGHSQGSFMAMLAADYDSRVRATVALGTGYNITGPGWNHQQCLVTDRVLPGDRLRATSGESDGTFGPTQVDQMNELTGMTCAITDTVCLRPDESGWVVALDADVFDGEAEHCYMGVAPPGTPGSGCNLMSDPIWLTTPDPWGRAAGADFLESFTDP